MKKKIAILILFSLALMAIGGCGLSRDKDLLINKKQPDQGYFKVG